MEINNKTLEKIEKRIWQLMLLAIVVILYLTLSLLGFQFLNFMGEKDLVLFSKDAYKWSFFLTIMILLFCAYMILHQRRLLHLSKSLFREKQSAENLNDDVTTLAALFEVSARINSKHKLQDILDTVSSEMLRCFRADRSSIMLLDRKSGTLKIMVSHGKRSELARDAIVPIGNSIGGWVLKTGQPLLLNGEVNPSDFPGIDVESRKISSAICVPLKVNNRTIGVLTLNLVDTDRIFSDSDLKLIGIFANNAAVAIQNAILLKERLKRFQMQTLFKQLHSPNIVKNLVERINKAGNGGKMREKMDVSILFADIRGFSKIVNMIDIEIMMDFLDEFYTVMARAVYKNEGNIDKFIGDEVMAFFGAPNRTRNSTEKCIKTAFEMKVCFKKLIEKFSKRSPLIKDLGLGIGINSGEVVIGNVGSRIRYDYTIIGNPVNLARRLCSYAKNNEILVTESTDKNISGKVLSKYMGKVRFKGIGHPVDIYGIEQFLQYIPLSPVSLKESRGYNEINTRRIIQCQAN